MSRDTPLDLIDPKPNKRYDQNSIDRIAKQIKTKGYVAPIQVQPNGDRFTIVNGGRRYLAVKKLGWETIPTTLSSSRLPEEVFAVVKEIAQTLNESKVGLVRRWKRPSLDEGNSVFSRNGNLRKLLFTPGSSTCHPLWTKDDIQLLLSAILHHQRP